MLPHPWKSTEHHPMFIDCGNPGVAVYVNAVYFPNWRVHRQQGPASLNLNFISHVFYAFAWPSQDGTIIFSDPYADIQMEIDGSLGGLHALKMLKITNPQLRTVLSIGGGGKGSEHFASVARSPLARQTFASSARELVLEYGFDGVDIDWEHPSDVRQGADYLELLDSVRRFLPSPRFIVTSALPAGEWALKNIDVGRASRYLDHINLMAYDFAGSWLPTSGHQSQLHAPPAPPGDVAAISGHSGATHLISNGVPPSKIVLGIPSYGRSFVGADGVGQPYTGSAGDDGTFEYKDLPRPEAKEYVDEGAAAAFCVGGDGGFVTYDNPRTVQMKANYVKEAKLGGLFYWTGTGDVKGPRSLVESGYNALHELR